ncbi:hypothetical protein PVL29_020063 [Vitis rotundifolia]|uniref:Light-mediated development protein DET1 n=1 Tax=Vitis rotundifolia TaxID=103349 RepID=A0AA39DG56_VITRO|nr:hypothetical protein PVL29_020063 [Vitis rotundifolia]
MFRSNNVVARIFQRQICTPAPGTSVHCARRFYENLVPSCTIYDVECPDHSFRKFTDDGQYLISFSRNNQDLIVYRPTWLSFSCKEEDCDSYDLPLKAKRFESFFTQLYCVSLASSNEFICKDFFLYMESNQFGLFATSTAQIHDAPATGGAVQGIPSIEKITFHLLRLEDGFRLDERVFHNDFVNLTHSMGVFLYDDLLAIVSLRYQTIHILQIRDSGNLVDVRAIGTFCREDDELFLNSNAQRVAGPHQLPRNHVENGLDHNQINMNNSFLSGIKQRLLSFIFRSISNEETDKTLRMQCLKKKFYFRFQDYVDLIVWKVGRRVFILLHVLYTLIASCTKLDMRLTCLFVCVLSHCEYIIQVLLHLSMVCNRLFIHFSGQAQFLDRHHLLIKFGSVDGGVRFLLI